MKRIISLLVVFAMAVTLISMPASDTVNAAKTKKLYIVVTPNITSMKVTWDKKKVSYFEVYRANVTKRIKNSKYSLKESKFKKIAKISGKKVSYVDKKVKMGQYYAYVVYGYKKTNGKAKKVLSSYIKGVLDYDYVGLYKPALNTFTAEEDIESDANFIILKTYSNFGAEPKKYIVYRKASNEKKFSKTDVVSLGRQEDTNIFVYRDENVKTQTEYQYKVKSYKKVGKKKYYSKFSNVFTVTPCNARAKFTVKSMTAAGTGVSDIVLKIDSDKNNGSIDFYKNYYPEDNYYTYQKEAWGKNYWYCADLRQYSFDNINWINIGDMTVTLDAGKTIYLKFRLSNQEEDDTTPIEFGSNTGIESDLWITSAKYHGPNRGKTTMRTNLIEGTGSAEQSWDE